MRLEIMNGCFRYPHGERTILKDINIALDSGSILAILGPNGAGKTTLLRCITGLLPWTSGVTRLDGTDASRIPRKTFWRDISYVPQAKQPPSGVTVENAVLLGRTVCISPFSLPSDADREAVDRALKRVGIEHLRRRYCSELSGGEYQMVLIARALVSDPKLIVLDEPESNLDFQNQLLVLDIISSLSKEGITCIFNTHYPAHAMRHADKAFLLGRDGSSCFGTVREVVTEENILRYFNVRAVIGEMETEDSSIADIVPMAIGGDFSGGTANNRLIAAITILMEGNDHADEVNQLLHEYEKEMIGRMGLPYRKAGVNIIMLTLDGASPRLFELTDKLKMIPKTHVKMTSIAGGEAHEQ